MSHRKSPDRHYVHPYRRGRFIVDGHYRGSARSRPSKVVGESKPVTRTKIVYRDRQSENVPKTDINMTIAYPDHKKNQVQVIYIEPREYLQLAAPMPFGGFNKGDYQGFEDYVDKNKAFLAPSLSVDPKGMQVVASKGIHAALWAYNHSIKRMPVLLIHVIKNSGMLVKEPYSPTTRKRDVDYRKLKRQGTDGPSAWDYV